MFRRKGKVTPLRPAPPPPYVLSKKTPRRTPGQYTCTLCQITLNTRLAGETLVEMKCGSLVHEECFGLRMDHRVDNYEYSYQARSKIGAELFPSCECGCDSRMVPADPDVESRWVTSVVDTHVVSASFNPNLAALSTTMSLSESEVHSVPSTVLTPMTSNVDSPSTKRRSRPLLPRPLLSRASSVDTSSVAPSILSIDSGTPQVGRYEGAAYEQLLKTFLTQLVRTCPSRTMTTLLQLGRLRLVDQLSVSLDAGKGWRSGIVYLFENYLVVEWPHPTPTIIKIDQYRTSGIKIPGVVELVAYENGVEKWRVWLKSEPDSVVEKWACALLEVTMDFPSQYVSSTVELELESSPVEAFLSTGIAGLEKGMLTTPETKPLPEPSLPRRNESFDRVSLSKSISNPVYTPRESLMTPSFLRPLGERDDDDDSSTIGPSTPKIDPHDTSSVYSQESPTPAAKIGARIGQGSHAEPISPSNRHRHIFREQIASMQDRPRSLRTQPKTPKSLSPLLEDITPKRPFKISDATPRQSPPITVRSESIARLFNYEYPSGSSLRLDFRRLDRLAAEDDSDVDSDQDIIEAALASRAAADWSSLFAELDRAICSTE
ncbi:hypothetical protein DICA3_D23948 [Diutina catenulata]